MIKDSIDIQETLDILNKLTEYESAEASGELIRIPKNSWYIQDGIIKQGEVLSVSYNRRRDGEAVILYTIENYAQEPFLGALGVTVFSTKQEAIDQCRTLNHSYNGT